MSTELVTLQHCSYIQSDGSICQNPNVVARGYCSTHYSVLRRANAFTDTIAKPRNPKQTVLANVASVRRARRKLLKMAPDVVDQLKVAIENEAKRGKSDAIRWAILHTETVAPIDVNPSHNSGPSHTTVNIGVKVSE